MLPTVRGPWVWLGHVHSAGDELVYDLETDQLLTLWFLEHEELEPVLGQWSFDHERVAPVCAWVEGESRSYLASPLAGVALFQLLRRTEKHDKRLPDSVALRIVLDVAEGFLVVMNHPPLNAVRFANPGRAVVTWSGETSLAIAPGRNPNVRANFAAPQPFFFELLSPEAVRGLPRTPKHYSWVLGALLFRALTGSRLEGDGSEFERLDRLTRQPLPEVSVLRPDLPAALLDLIGSVLHREADARPDLELVIAALEALAPASHAEVADVLGHLFEDTRDYVFDTLEQLRAAPPEPDGELGVQRG